MLKKAVIFDDEYIVLQGLKMIDWPKYGIEVVGTASNGVEALEVFAACQPDIVFSDIRMPGLDGLQVIERIVGEKPETVCIVFSGFNEFEYVKRAIKLGVADYLEKPITISMIEEAIERIIEKLNLQNSMTTLQSKLETNRVELLEKATLDLILIGSEAKGRWKECFGPGSDRLTGVTVFALSEKGPELINPSFQTVSIRNGEEFLLAAIHFDHEVDGLFEELQKWAEEHESYIGAGKTYLQLEEASQSYKEAKKALRYGRFLEENWTHIDAIGGDTKSHGGLSEQEESILFHLRTGEKTSLFEQLDAFINQLKLKRINPDIVERESLKLVYLALEAAKESRQEEGKLEGYLPHMEVRSLDTKEKMFKWLKDQMNMIFDLTRNVNPATKHEAVRKACAYMMEHFNQDLTLQEVADFIGMNPTYFSLLFKEEMDQSYIKYLTNLRINKAKDLLLAGYKVTDVSERVGYHSYRHFSDIFKKLVGVKPSQYKKPELHIKS